MGASPDDFHRGLSAARAAQAAAGAHHTMVAGMLLRAMHRPPSMQHSQSRTGLPGLHAPTCASVQQQQHVNMQSTGALHVDLADDHVCLHQSCRARLSNGKQLLPCRADLSGLGTCHCVSVLLHTSQCSSSAAVNLVHPLKASASAAAVFVPRSSRKSCARRGLMRSLSCSGRQTRRQHWHPARGSSTPLPALQGSAQM